MRRALLGVLGLVGVAAACQGPGLEVTQWHTPAVDTRGARALAVTDAYGRSPAVAMAADVALAEIGAGSWYVGLDATRDRLELDDGGAYLADRAMRADALYLRLDVLEWYVTVTPEVRDGTDASGNPVTVLVDVSNAHAYLSATLADGAGRVLLDSYEVEGIHTEDGYADDVAALEQATRVAVRQLLAELTPTQQKDFVPFDARDEAEKPILERAHDDILAALDAEAQFILAHPHSAAAVYNQAVMLDHVQDFDGALAGYDAARALHPDSTLAALISEARSGCAERLHAAQALGL